MLAKCANPDCSEHLRGKRFSTSLPLQIYKSPLHERFWLCARIIACDHLTRARDRSYTTITDEWGKLCHDGRGVR